jgi:hypothetical protein
MMGTCVAGRGPFRIVEIEEPTEFDQEPTDDMFIYPALIKVQVINSEMWAKEE